MPPRRASTTSASSSSAKASTATTPSKKKVAGAKRKADTDAEEQSKTDEKETVSPAATSSPPPASVDDESKEDDKAVDPSDPMTVDPATLGLPELKAQLKAWGLLYSGLKGDLIKRYRAYVKTGKIPAKKKPKRDVFSSFDKKSDAKDPFHKANAARSAFYANMWANQ